MLITPKNTIIPVFIVATFMLFAQIADASWTLNENKFHISAHGQTSCLDCHEDISETDLHPNPTDVDKRRTDFFSAEKCLTCHDEIIDNLNEGFHGSKRIKSQKKYEYCIRCHKPHTQRRLGQNRMGKFDPDRPRHKQCGACHEKKSALPALSSEDKSCMSCHGSVEPEDPAYTGKTSLLCFSCHGQGTEAAEMTGKAVSLIDVKEYASTTHAHMACTDCHLKSDQFMHANQTTKDCRRCHLPHDEKVAHDAHMGVTCEACHLGGIKAVKDPESGLVSGSKGHKPAQISGIHHMTPGPGETSCKRCHFKGNRVGAAAMILPAKSIICMPCHTATFSVGDTTAIIALIIFLAGIVLSFSYWLSGSVPGTEDAGPAGKFLILLRNIIRTIFSPKIVLIIKTLILDVLLQRRLFRQSQGRWLIHSLIFLPFVFRLTWGLVALTASLLAPECPATWPLLNKNNPCTAFLFDVTGIMVLSGAVFAFIRGFFKKSDQSPGLPGQDRLALCLIGGIIIVGFILEGMRISMTGNPPGAWYAFIGYMISTLFSDITGLTGFYGYIWYMHAVLTGVFIAYLPFSRMFHIIMGPVVLVMNAVAGHEKGR